MQQIIRLLRENSQLTVHMCPLFKSVADLYNIHNSIYLYFQVISKFYHDLQNTKK